MKDLHDKVFNIIDKGVSWVNTDFNGRGQMVGIKDTTNVIVNLIQEEALPKVYTQDVIPAREKDFEHSVEVLINTEAGRFDIGWYDFKFKRWVSNGMSDSIARNAKFNWCYIPKALSESKIEE
jgi:hypothetical protein